MFQFFSYHSHEHCLPAFAVLFSFVPILLPPNPTLSFFTGESAGISSHPFKQITHLSRLCFEGQSLLLLGCHKSVFNQFNLTHTFLFTDKTYFV
jgi:hypothetical protein